MEDLVNSMEEVLCTCLWTGWGPLASLIKLLTYTSIYWTGLWHRCLMVGIVGAALSFAKLLGIVHMELVVCALLGVLAIPASW